MLLIRPGYPLYLNSHENKYKQERYLKSPHIFLETPIICFKIKLTKYNKTTEIFNFNTESNLLNKEWAVRSIPLITWKSPLWNLPTISVMRSGHLSGKSSLPTMLIASLNWKQNPGNLLLCNVAWDLNSLAGANKYFQMTCLILSLVCP